MGAVPSRDVHESSLFSCFLGKDNKWQILLLPLTRTFFPSPDCPLFRAFHAARTCDQVYFNFVRPSTSPRPCDEEDVGAAVSTTHDRVTRGELYRDYVDAIEAHLVQETSERLRAKLLAGEEVLRPLPCAVLEIREVATTKGSSVASGEEEAKDKGPLLLPTSEWVPIALHGQDFEARVLGYYGVRSTQTSTTAEDCVLTVGTFVHQSVSEDMFVALTAAAGRMFDEQCRAAGILRSDGTMEQRDQSPSSSSSSCNVQQTTTGVLELGSSPQRVMVSSLVMLPVLFHSSITRYAVLRSTLECVSLLERRMGRPFVEAAMKVQVTKQGRLEVRVDRRLCDRLLQELLLPMTSWNASSSATGTDHRPSSTPSDAPASMPMISFLHELEQAVKQELQVARKAPINHGQWERLGNTGCTWALCPQTKSTIRKAIRTFESLENSDDGSGRVVEGDGDDADLGGSADQLSLLPYCMTASAHHNNVPKAWVAEVSAVLRRAVQSTFGEDVVLPTLEPSSKVPVTNVRDFLLRVEGELSGSAQVVETILKRIASSERAPPKRQMSTSTTRAIWMVPLAAGSIPSLQPPPAAAALPTSGRPAMLQLQIDLPLTHTVESGSLVDSSTKGEHHFPGTLRSMFFKP